MCACVRARVRIQAKAGTGLTWLPAVFDTRVGCIYTHTQRRWGSSLEAQLSMAQAALAAEREESGALTLEAEELRMQATNTQ